MASMMFLSVLKYMSVRFEFRDCRLIYAKNLRQALLRKFRASRNSLSAIFAR